MPRSNRTKMKNEKKKGRKRKGTEIDHGNASDMKEQVSTFLKKADDAPVPSKKRRVTSSSSSDGEKELLSKEDFQKNKELVILRKKRSLEYPKLFFEESYKKKKDPKSSKAHLSIEDVQQLAIHGLIGQHDTSPSWCRLLRTGKISKVALLIIDGVSEKCYRRNKDCFTYIQQHFDVTSKVAMNPNQNVTEDLMYRPVSKEKKKYLRRGHLLEDTKKKERETVANNLNNNSNEKKTNGALSPKGKGATSGECCRTDLLLSSDDLVKRKFPTGTETDFQSTNHIQEVNDSSPLIGLDCEMCTTAVGNELTRVSLVNEDGTKLFNSLVKPDNTIINYQTRYSGITKQMLDPVTTRLKDVQEQMFALLPQDAILVGQSIENDLRALKLHHPHIIDTSRMFTSYPLSLKKLTKFYLGRDIQTGSAGHDSIEDALASLDLAKLKIKKGDSIKSYHQGGDDKKRIREWKESIFMKAGPDTVSMMVDSESIHKRLYKEPVGCIHTSNDTETRKKAVSAIANSQFLWAQFHSYRTYLEGSTQEEDEQKKLLSQLDGRVKKIYKALPDKSLVITLMCENTRGIRGKLPGDSNPILLGRMFAGIKVSPVVVD